MRKVLIAAGGSGGHLLPAQQLAKRLEQIHGAKVVFAGYKLQNSPFFAQSGFRFYDVKSAPIGWRFLKGFIPGVWQSFKVLWKEKPDVVVGFGSYHAVPILFASVILRKKIVLYEANRTIGKVNRLFRPFAKIFASQFPFDKGSLVPLFPWIAPKKIERKEARLAYGLDPDCFTILVFGGSQGAQFLNESMPEVVKLLGPVQVLHFGGEVNYSVKSVVKTFETNMAAAYAAADFAVCRSGAGTVAELIRFQVPSLLIPYPFAYGHQEHNADYLVQLGGASMLLQSEATPEKMAELIRSANVETMKFALKSVEEQNRIDLDHLVVR